MRMRGDWQNQHIRNQHLKRQKSPNQVLQGTSGHRGLSKIIFPTK